MTPTLPVALRPVGAGAELPAAPELVDLQTALTLPPDELLPEDELLELLFEEPQAATANVATALSATRDRVDLRMYVRLPIGVGPVEAPAALYVSTDNILGRWVAVTVALP